MYLVDFMNTHPDNWRELLAAEPYYISISQKGAYFLLKYNQFESDFNLPEVIEARGSIFRHDDERGWICVARSLDKFGNWQEPYAATDKINWSHGVDVQEKVDGSIMRMWYDDGKWHLSTNGTIDAADAASSDTTFEEIFNRLIGDREAFEVILNKDYCYWFEIVSHSNVIVVQYNHEGIYYLGCRNMVTMEESTEQLKWYRLLYPQHYTYHSLDACIAAAHNMGANEEGYVVVSADKENGSFLRVKVKGDEYIRLHHMRGENNLTAKRVIEMWQEDSLDDFLAFFPQHLDMVVQTMGRVEYLAHALDRRWEEAAKYAENRKQFALYVNGHYPSFTCGWLFARLSGRVKSGVDYLRHINAEKVANVVTETLTEI